MNAKLDTEQNIGPYQIVGLLGEGGMASVYRAYQSNANREVALKVIRPEMNEHEEFVRRFEREVAIIERLTHRHIIELYDHGHQDDFAYLVMPYLSGGSLFQKETLLPPERINTLLTQIASALGYAHRQGIIHRDLKPANILLNEAGEAVLTDFGIAKVLHETLALTRTGIAMGTPPYMAPEQWRGEVVDARTDVYALGVVLFEMLTGSLPFKAVDAMSLMHQHIYQSPPSISQWHAEIPSRLDAVIQKALAKHPERRFQSTEELAVAFSAVLEKDGLWSVVQSNETVPLPRQMEQYKEAITPILPAQAAQQEQDALAHLDVERLSRQT